ncbi:hypothetical protein Efla_004656 [Eimeria flavescens]
MILKRAILWALAAAAHGPFVDCLNLTKAEAPAGRSLAHIANPLDVRHPDFPFPNASWLEDDSSVSSTRRRTHQSHGLWHLSLLACCYCCVCCFRRPLKVEEISGERQDYVAASQAARARSLFARVRAFFNVKALRNKALIDAATEDFANTPEAARVLDCVHLSPRAEWLATGRKFCIKFDNTKLRAACFLLLNAADARLTAAAKACPQPVKGSCLLQALRLPLSHPLVNGKAEGDAMYPLQPASLPRLSVEFFSPQSRWQQLLGFQELLNREFPTRLALRLRVEERIKHLQRKAVKAKKHEKQEELFWEAWELTLLQLESKPHVEPTLIRLIHLHLSLKGCPKESLSLPVGGKTEKVATADVRRKLLSRAFGESIKIRNCRDEEEEKSFNCLTLLHFTRMKQTLQKYFHAISGSNLPTENTHFYKGEELESLDEKEMEKIREEIEEEAQADFTFAQDVAGKVQMRFVDFLGKSRLARSMVASLVSGILGFIDKFRKEKGKKTRAAAPLQQAREAAAPLSPTRSREALKAFAFFTGASRASSIYSMSARKGLAELQGHIVAKVLKKKLKKEMEKQRPKKKLGDRVRGLFSFRRKQAARDSFLLLQQTERRQANAATRTVSNRTSFLLIVKEPKGMPKTATFLLAGGAFLFIGISMLGSLAPGALAVGLIIAGIVAILIPLIKKAWELMSGRAQGAGGGEAEEEGGPEEREEEGGGEEEEEEE